jgi:hypothetical protein
VRSQVAAVVLAVLCSGSGARADGYIDAAGKGLLFDGRGPGNLGVGVGVAPRPWIEVELSASRHRLVPDPFQEGPSSLPDSSWMLQGMVRGRLAFRRLGFLLGAGVLTGADAARSGSYCYASSFLAGFCPDGNTPDTRSYVRWERMWALRVDFGGEVLLGPVVLRATVGPSMPLNDPDVATGLHPHARSSSIFELSVRARLPLPF